MNYGLSNAVDTLATTSGYNHPNAHVLLGSAPWMLLDNTESPLLPRHPSIKNRKETTHQKKGEEVLKVHVPKNRRDSTSYDFNERRRSFEKKFTFRKTNAAANADDFNECS